MLPFQHNFFHEIQTPKVDYKHVRMMEIGQHQIYQLIKPYALLARETNPTDFDKLELRYNPKRPKVVAPKLSGRARSTRG